MRRLVTAAAGILLISGCAASTPAPSASQSAADQGRLVLCAPSEPHLTASPSFQAYDSDVVVGPFSWPHLKAWATADPSGYGDRNDYKIGAQVKAGSTVTVAVAPEARAHAGLSYGLAAGHYSPTPVVTFHACATADTAFIGGFHVDSPQCVPFDISADGKPPVRVVVSFFDGPCGARVRLPIGTFQADAPVGVCVAMMITDPAATAIRAQFWDAGRSGDCTTTTSGFVRATARLVEGNVVAIDIQLLPTRVEALRFHIVATSFTEIDATATGSGSSPVHVRLRKVTRVAPVAPAPTPRG